MPSIISHPAVVLALAPFVPKKIVNPKTIVATAACSALPDIDVQAFAWHIPYGAMFGHRGFTHSFVFALITSTLLMLVVTRKDPSLRKPTLAFLFLAAVSHPLLDAMTSGGLGIAFFSPFSNHRYFFPWRPIKVSPIGLYDFFSEGPGGVLFSELKWVWLPCILIFSAGLLIRKKTTEAQRHGDKTV